MTWCATLHLLATSSQLAEIAQRSAFRFTSWYPPVPCKLNTAKGIKAYLVLVVKPKTFEAKAKAKLGAEQGLSTDDVNSFLSDFLAQHTCKRFRAVKDELSKRQDKKLQCYLDCCQPMNHDRCGLSPSDRLKIYLIILLDLQKRSLPRR